MTVKPQLAYNKEWKWHELNFHPFYISEKLDGFRCLTTQNGSQTKSLKRIANKWISEQLKKCPIGLDGELITYTNGVQDDFHTCSGKLRTIDLKHLEFQYFVFDAHHFAQGVPYIKRLEWIQTLDLPANVRVLPQHLASCEGDVIGLLNYWKNIKQEVEGVMIRNGQSGYKHGRCTLKEQNIFKFVEWHRDEAMIVDFTPNTEHSDRIGAIKCSWRGQFIYLGSGFNHALSHDMLTNPSHYLGKTVTFKYKCIDTLPRQPIFVGFYEGD